MTADERINALIARAGSPVMVVKNTQESVSPHGWIRIMTPRVHAGRQITPFTPSAQGDF